MAIIRFGISLDDTLLEKFDRLIAGKGYANRSEAIRDLIRDNLVDIVKISMKTQGGG